jgi:hypothetical protein
MQIGCARCVAWSLSVVMAFVLVLFCYDGSRNKIRFVLHLLRAAMSDCLMQLLNVSYYIFIHDDNIYYLNHITFILNAGYYPFVFLIIGR